MRTWIFSDFAVPSPELLNLYQNCCFSDVVLGVTTGTEKFKLNHKEQPWIDAANMVGERAMKSHLMTWAVPTEEYMKRALGELHGIARSCNASSILFNAEKTWQVGEEAQREAAVQVLADYTRQAGALDVGVVGLGDLHPNVRTLAAACRYIIPEAYSIWKPERLCGGKRHWSHTWKTFPGPQQRRAYEDWWLDFPEKDFAMGMACYWGDRPQRGTAPPLTEAQSMRYAMAETIAIWHEVAVGTTHRQNSFWGAAYWSGKHLTGTSDGRKARRAFMKMISEA